MWMGCARRAGLARHPLEDRHRALPARPTASRRTLAAPSAPSARMACTLMSRLLYAAMRAPPGRSCTGPRAACAALAASVSALAARARIAVLSRWPLVLARLRASSALKDWWRTRGTCVVSHRAVLAAKRVAVTRLHARSVRPAPSLRAAARHAKRVLRATCRRLAARRAQHALWAPSRQLTAWGASRVRQARTRPCRHHPAASVREGRCRRSLGRRIVPRARGCSFRTRLELAACRRAAQGSELCPRASACSARRGVRRLVAAPDAAIALSAASRPARGRRPALSARTGSCPRRTGRHA